jgi:DNA-binding transcriptional LysR family regulator
MIAGAMDRFANIETFVRVAQTQSFAEAARQLRISRSVVTTRVKQLEEFVGGALFHRNTRSVRLSETGQAFLRDCVGLINKANEIVDHMREARGSPAGQLRVHALPGFVLGHLAQVLRAFQESYPEIVLDLFVSDAIIDPVKTGFDCALQIFPPASEELVARHLFPVRRVFCASAKYLKAHGTPKHPRELAEHRLGLYSGYPSRDRWVFHKEGKQVAVELKAVLSTNSVHLLRDYAEEHAGIVCLPTLVAAEALLAGTFKLVLADHQLSSFSMSVVYPQTARSAFKLKLFIESLVASFSADEPPWDRALIEKGLIAHALIE